MRAVALPGSGCYVWLCRIAIVVVKRVGKLVNKLVEKLVNKLVERQAGEPFG